MSTSGSSLRGQALAACAIVCLAAASAISASGVASAAPPPTVVSLTFDNTTASQYTVGFQRALQPHGVGATFFVNSGLVGASPNQMSWSQLAALAANGSEIGGKTVDGSIAVSGTDNHQAKVDEVCNDRQALLQHGLNPISFAYPFGAWDGPAQDIVRNCGYGTGRAGGGLSPTGPQYAETLPPRDWFGTYAYAPSGQATLADLQGLVTGAAAGGGGWSQVVVQSVCSQQFDPANYAACTSTWGWMELDVLNAFLDWIQQAGQPGGAPDGAVLRTVGAAAISADTLPPTTSIACNGTACAGAAYTSTVYVSLLATDTGAGVAETHYTLDGTEPTLSSSRYTAPFPLTATTTVRYRSWDTAGHAEDPRSQAIQLNLAPDSTPPTATVTCNGAACASTAYTAVVTVALAATDNSGGWGVNKIYYTTNGSTPTTSSTVYTGPFTIAQNATVGYFATDLAGNAGAPRSQVLKFQTIVTLTFDDGITNQYTLAYQRALRPRNMHATFYINSGQMGPAWGSMTWAQLTTVALSGNEVGGHTVDHVNLTTISQQAAINEVCNDRKTLVSRGFNPSTFAFPEGAYNAALQQIVRDCGYGNARAAGGLDVAGTGAGPVRAESLPPKDKLALRTVYDQGPGAIQLAFLQASVVAATQNGGGWTPFIFHQVCSQQYDPANYPNCNNYGTVELTVLTGFLDWLKNAGQPGGAPAGTVVRTVKEALA
ncbi:polysaccharide deacetylase family protein [Longispora sp. K20-0274]|uniref:polysaccharide deacetylase family protein n=1 Tax=Longispora sp. K20-0274 TaxID=3088255 RepID=UPI0039995692